MTTTKKKIQGATHESERDNNERDKQELRDFREYGHKTPAEQNAAERWYKLKKKRKKKYGHKTPAEQIGAQRWRTFSRVLSLVIFCSKCTRTLTFENFS